MADYLTLYGCKRCGGVRTVERCDRCASSEGLRWWQGRRWYEWACVGVAMCLTLGLLLNWWVKR